MISAVRSFLLLFVASHELVRARFVADCCFACLLSYMLIFVADCCVACIISPSVPIVLLCWLFLVAVPWQFCVRWLLLPCCRMAESAVNPQLQRMTLEAVLLFPRPISQPSLNSHLWTSLAHLLQKQTKKKFPSWRQFGMISMLSVLAWTHGDACAATNYSSQSTQQGLLRTWPKRRTWVLQSVLQVPQKNILSGTLICFTEPSTRPSTANEGKKQFSTLPKPVKMLLLSLFVKRN